MNVHEIIVHGGTLTWMFRMLTGFSLQIVESYSLQASMISGLFQFNILRRILIIKQNFTQQLPEDTTQDEAIAENENDTQESDSYPSDRPPTSTSRLLTGLTPFWHDRLIEVALVLSMALYYVIGNTNLGAGRLFHLNPLISLPFLLIFAVLCWYRLPFAIALIPLGLPYYFQ